MDELEERYGFAAELAACTDQQILAQRRAEQQKSGWGNARAYFMSCLTSEVQSRNLEPIDHDQPNGKTS